MNRRGRRSSEDSSVTTATDAASTSRTVETNESKPKAKLDKSGLYDMQQVKRLLDDEVMAVCSKHSQLHLRQEQTCEHTARLRTLSFSDLTCIFLYKNVPCYLFQFMDDQGYVESTFVSNVKIVAGTIAVAAALYSHFGPGEFPANKPVVFACVAIYIFCVSLINLTSFVLEASAIYVGTLTSRMIQVSQGSLAKKIWVHTTIGGKGSSDYKVELRLASRSKKGSVAKSTPYEKFITEDGRFLSDVFRAEMRSILSELSPGVKKTN